jgi:hypothetical protein
LPGVVHRRTLVGVATPTWIWDVVIGLVVVAGIYGFVGLTRGRTRHLTRRTTRRAEDMYDEFDDSPAAKRRFARKRGGTWHDKE